MKIMFYIGSLGKGGAERVVSNLSNNLITNHHVSIVTTIDCKSDYLLDKKIKLFSLNQGKIHKNVLTKNIFYLKRLKKIINSEKPDIILTFLPEPSYRTLILKRSIKVPVIVSVRNDPRVEYKNPINHIMMKMLYRRADGFVFQTKEAQEYFSKKLQKRSVIIANPVEQHFFQEEYAPKDSKIFVNVGRLNEQKNQLFLIRCFEPIFKQYPDFKLWIYGDGTQREILQDYIISHRLENHVKLCGCVDHIEQILKDKFAFVLSSKYEGMPNALMEAMAIGLPCISTDCPCGGPREIITNNVDGILVENENAEAMTNAILELIHDHEKKELLSKNAKKNMARFQPELIYKEWSHFIEEVYFYAKNN